MWHRPDVYIPLVYLLGAIPYAALGLYAWHRRPAVAVAPFAWTMLGCSIWSFGYGLEVYFPSLVMKLLAVKVEYIGIIIIPVFLLFFAVEFTGKSHLLSPRARYLIWVIPVAVLILVWLNPWLRWMWSMESVKESEGLLLLDIRRGFFFWLHIFYSYALVLIAVLLLVMDLLQRPGFYRIQIGLVVLCVLFPLIGNFIFVSDSGPLKNLDLTPLFFIPTALGLSWAVFKYRLLEILPPEHFTVLKNMKNGVIILNPQNRILYINPVMEGLMKRREDEVIGQPLAHAAEPLFAKLGPCLVGGKQHVEISFDDNGHPVIYDVSVSLAHHQDRRVESAPNRVIVFHDITARKQVEADLSRREAVMSAVNFAAERFLKESRWEHHIPAVLEKLGQAADVSRIFVSVNYVDDKNVTYSSLCYEWAAPGISSHIRNPALQHVPFRAAGFGRWENMLSENLPIHGLVRDLPAAERMFLQALRSVSFAAIPIFVERQWWGFIMFDECRHERVWSNTELKAFHAAASIFGAAETRARTEQKLFRRQSTLSLLHDIVAISLRANTLNEMASAVVGQVGELIKADGCFMTLWNEEEKRAVPLAAYGPLQAVYETLTVQPGERTFTESALRLGHTLIVEDTRNTPYAERRIVEKFPSRSLITLPLIAKDKKLGALLLAFDTFHRFSSEEISISEQASALIALALEKFQAMEKAKQRADVSETLRKAASAVTETLETDKTVSRILEQLQQVIAYDSASIHMRIGEELVIVGGQGFPNLNAILGLRFRTADEPQRTVLETRKPFYIPDLTAYPHGFKDVAGLRIRSWVGLPLIARDNTIGLLAIDSLQPNRFKEKDIQLAAEFASQVAAALENARRFEETQTQAVTDPLTGVFNRRGLFQSGELEFKRVRRSRQPFCAMMFDIDRFKRVNDRHGHAVGDQILHQLAQRARKNSRHIDLLGRYGGEEFTILLPEANLSSAQRIAERLRKAVMDEPFETDAGALRVTISIGVAEMNKEDTLQSLIERADAALYRAKDAGRNRVVTDDAAQPRRQT